MNSSGMSLGTALSICPLCGTEIKASRILRESVICECGWCDSSAIEKAGDQQTKFTIKVFAVVSAVLLIGYGHLLTWGSYAGTIPFLKMGEAAGWLSPSGYEKIIEACVTQNRWGCAEQAHIDLYRKTADPEVMARLGKLQFLLKENQQAANSYDTYFKIGGKNPEASLNYGQVLEQLGQNEKAEEMYRKSMADNQEKLPINATSRLVHLLLQQKNYNEARIVIDTFHESAENAKGYLNSEADEVDKILGPPTKKKIARR
jgi:tetratricopeptide (TPR) repeat protein